MESTAINWANVQTVKLNGTDASKVVLDGATHWERVTAMVDTEVWVEEGHTESTYTKQSSGQGIQPWVCGGGSGPLLGQSVNFSAPPFWVGDVKVTGHTAGPPAEYVCRASTRAPAYITYQYEIWAGGDVWVDTSHYETQSVETTSYNYIT